MSQKTELVFPHRKTMILSSSYKMEAALKQSSAFVFAADMTMMIQCQIILLEYFATVSAKPSA